MKRTILRLLPASASHGFRWAQEPYRPRSLHRQLHPSAHMQFANHAHLTATLKTLVTQKLGHLLAPLRFRHRVFALFDVRILHLRRQNAPLWISLRKGHPLGSPQLAPLQRVRWKHSSDGFGGFVAPGDDPVTRFLYERHLGPLPFVGISGFSLKVRLADGGLRDGRPISPRAL